MTEKRGVLMVCLGNICRSPIAEAVFADAIKKRGLQDKFFVDSCAIGGWHVGNSPDSRAMSTLKKHNVDYKHKARQICKEDFDRFDFIFGMDSSNISDIEDRRRRWKSSDKAVVEMFGNHHPESKGITIRDPYYDSDDNGFEECYQRCVACTNGFLDKHA